MNDADKKKMIKGNSLLWLVAMIMPAFFSFALSGTKFPWPVVLPFLLLGLMLASNKLLTRALDGPPPASE